jgi:3-oxoacyl-[acyl-carrier protein] reductase
MTTTPDAAAAHRTGLLGTIDVRDRVVIVTGAAQGIGRTYAIEFARAGAKVVVADIQGDKAAVVAQEIAAEGHAAIAQAIDVAAPESVRRGIDATLAAFGRIDVLINNAAIFTPLGRRVFDEIPFEEWERVLRVNVTGSWLCASAVAPVMRKAGWGRIVNISSSTVPMGLPMFTHYVTSKAAVIGMTRAMARELGPHGITVNCVLPGLTDTEVDNPGRTDAMRAKVVDLQCVKRIERPEDLVGMLLFLASPASAFVTGQSIAVDGGSVFL